MQIIDLRTENQSAPIQIDCAQPRFSWRADTDEKNWYQKSYRIRVWEAAVGMTTRLVWDSGVVCSRAMNQVIYQGEPLKSDSRYCWNVEVTKEGSDKQTLSEMAYFETAFYSDKDWQAQWISEPQDAYHLYRTEFEAGSNVASAKLFICGLGHQECVVNGQLVTDAVLEAGWTDYRKTCLYCAYDVTALIKDKENAICIKLGDGMYNVPGGRYVYFPRSYGERKLLAVLRITYADGHIQRIATSDDWQIGKSPIQFCCIYGGEDYDGRIDWKAYGVWGCDVSSWTKAIVCEAPKGKLCARQTPPLKVMQQYKPVSVIKKEDGSYLYDFGTNFSGWVRLCIETDGTSAGEKVVLTPAEILTKDGEPDQRVTGRGYAWTYLCNEGEYQEFSPDFTYTGFRYVKAAVPKGVTIKALTGEFLYPKLEEAGNFSCSNELFNQIHKIIRQAMLSNIKSYFTDCPHREKLGWLEQTHLIGPAMMCNWNLELFYEKIEQDIADSQHEDGLVPDICPEYVTGFDKWHTGFVDSPEWGSACIINPWLLSSKYGNFSAIEHWYEPMKKYVDYLTSKTRYGILHHGLGDWLDIGPCTPYSQNTPVFITATCIYYMDLTIMEQAAHRLKKTEDEKQFARQRVYVYEEYNRQFLDDQTGRYANGSQACQAMSLMAGLVPEKYEKKAINQLKDEVVKRDFAITAGDVGHPYLVASLMKYQMNDILNEMTNITDRPGYGYQVEKGATTLTEEWDGPDPKHPHGSQNHLMLGSIDEWFFAGLGGIKSIHTNTDFDHIEICPHIAKKIDACSVQMKHPYGQICVLWKRQADDIQMTVTVPPNTTAVLLSEDKKVEQVVGSGTYHFTIRGESDD